MKNRIASWAVVACLSAYTSSAYALAVGEMRVLSALGEPLKIQLNLTDLGNTPATEARVIMAPAEDYSRLGLIPPLGADQWQVVMQNNGTLAAVISGATPQQEANVSFLVQLIWPGNIRVQQVTAVLLPETSVATNPVMAAPNLAETQPVAEAPAQGSATLSVEQSVTAASLLVKPAPGAKPYVPEIERIETAPQTKRTQAGDTLSSLADEWTLPQASLVQKQQVLAEANPRIFIDNNINQLKRGAIVQYPQASSVSLPDPDQAKQWLAARLAATAPAAAVPVDQPALASEPATAAPSGDDEVSLTLISPKAADDQQAAQAEALIADELAELSSEKNALLAERAALQAELAALENTGKAQEAKLKVLDEKLALLNAAKPESAEKAPTASPAADDGLRLSWVAAAVGFLIALLIVLRRRAAAASNAALVARAAPIVPVANDYVAFEPLESLPTPPWTAAHAATEPEAATVTASESATEMPPSSEPVSPEPASLREPVQAPVVAAVEPVTEAAELAAAESDAVDAEEEYDFMTDAESAALQTRLDLAQAYIDMNEMDLAKELLQTVVTRGTPEQQAQAQTILDKLS